MSREEVMARDRELGRLAREFEASTCPHALVDLADVSFMDSAGAGLLGRLHQLGSQRHGGVAVVGARPHIRRMLTIMGLTAICADQEPHAQTRPDGRPPPLRWSRRRNPMQSLDL